jgi:hypothetical protein
MAEPAEQAGATGLMETALRRMREALELLDQAQAPADVGAHLDMAIARLTEVVEPDSNGS